MASNIVIFFIVYFYMYKHIMISNYIIIILSTFCVLQTISTFQNYNNDFEIFGRYNLCIS